MKTESRQSPAEKLALNFVLGVMEIDVNVFKKEGAKKVKVQPTTVVKNLQEKLEINSHGLQELRLDMAPLMV